jgi:hypothetical protein
MNYKLAIIVVFASRALLAVDGQVLINSSTVSAAGGFPYHITQPGSYKLSGNLQSPLNKATIHIDASDVVLDLNGFNVECSYDEASGSGGSCITDNNVPTTGVTIRNGSVTVTGTAPTFGFREVVGINLIASKGATIENIHFGAPMIRNFAANGLLSGVYSIVRHNLFTDNATPASNCPSLVEGNINQTGGGGSSGSGCVYVNNLGLF